MAAVITGVDPHKASHTAAAIGQVAPALAPSWARSPAPGRRRGRRWSSTVPFRRDISQVTADHAGVVRCRGPLLLAVGCCRLLPPLRSAALAANWQGRPGKMSPRLSGVPLTAIGHRKPTRIG